MLSASCLSQHIFPQSRLFKKEQNKKGPKHPQSVFVYVRNKLQGNVYFNTA